jgi:hypothetical protein
VDGEIDIQLVVEDKESTGTKRKRKTTKTHVWKVEQLNGPLQPFSDTLWGNATREYITLLGEVPPEAMTDIISEARVIAKNRASKGTVSEEPRSERATLTFR